MFTRCTESFAQTDLERPLRYRDEHNIHYDDAAYDEDDHSDRHDNSRDRACKLIHLCAKFVGVYKAECFFRTADKLAAVPKQKARLINYRRKHLFVRRLSVNLDAAGPRKHLVVKRNRHINHAVHRIAEKRAAFLLDADHLQRNAANLQRFTDSRAAC